MDTHAVAILFFTPYLYVHDTLADYLFLSQEKPGKPGEATECITLQMQKLLSIAATENF